MSNWRNLSAYLVPSLNTLNLILLEALVLLMSNWLSSLSTAFPNLLMSTFFIALWTPLYGSVVSKSMKRLYFRFRLEIYSSFVLFLIMSLIEPFTNYSDLSPPTSPPLSSSIGISSSTLVISFIFSIQGFSIRTKLILLASFASSLLLPELASIKSPSFLTLMRRWNETEITLWGCRVSEF